MTAFSIFFQTAKGITDSSVCVFGCCFFFSPPNVVKLLKIIAGAFFNLKGREEEINEELGETQTDGFFGGLIRQEDKNHLVDTQQGDEGQGRLGQPEMEGGRRGERENQQKSVACCINGDKLQRQKLELT